MIIILSVCAQINHKNRVEVEADDMCATRGLSIARMVYSKRQHSERIQIMRHR